MKSTSSLLSNSLLLRSCVILFSMSTNTRAFFDEHVLHSEGKFHDFKGDASRQSKNTKIVHSESFGRFVDTFDHMHPIFLSVAEEVANAKAEEYLKTFPEAEGAGSLSPLAAWTANDEHMKTIKLIRNVHHDNPHAMVFMEMVSKRVLAKIVDNKFCEIGAKEQPGVTHIQTLKRSIETSINNLKSIFNGIRDLVSSSFKKMFGSFSEWISKELKKPAWSHMSKGFIRIINFCGVNFGYAIPFQPIDAINPSLPSFVITCQPLSDFLIIAGRALVLIGNFLKEIFRWILSLFTRVFKKTEETKVVDTKKDTTVQSMRCCVRHTLIRRDFCALIPEKQDCSQIPVKDVLGAGDSWNQITYNEHEPMCCIPGTHDFNTDPDKRTEIEIKRCEHTQCATLVKTKTSGNSKWTMLMPNSEMDNTAKTCGKCQLRIQFMFAFTLADFVTTAATSGAAGYSGFKIVVSTMPMNLQTIKSDCTKCISKVKGFFLPGPSMEQKYFKDSCNPHSLGMCLILAKQRVCGQTWSGGEVADDELTRNVRSVYEEGAIGESLRSGLESSGRYMKGRRFCNSLDGITLNMLYRQDETNLRHLIECNTNDMGATSREDYFDIDLEVGCHAVNDKLLEEDTVLTNVKIENDEKKTCLFYHNSIDSDKINTKAQLNDRLMSRCREIFNCDVSSDTTSSSSMDRRAIKTQMVGEIKKILNDVDDTQGGYSTISIASATGLLTEVVETYGSIIKEVYKSENALAKCESMWMQSPSRVFQHPLWQDQCFRDGNKVPLRKAINSVDGTSDTGDVFQDQIGEEQEQIGEEQSQCCVRRHKKKLIGKKTNDCKNHVITEPCDGEWEATTISGCCDHTLPLDQVHKCKEKGCTPDKSKRKKVGVGSKIVRKVSSMATKVMNQAAEMSGFERSTAKGKRLMYEVAKGKRGPFFGEIVARAHGLFSMDTTQSSGRESTEICEGVDETPLTSTIEDSCGPDQVNKLLAKVEFNKREKECDSLKSKYLSVWSKLTRGSPTNIGGLAAIMQHGHRTKNDEYKAFPPENMAVYYLCDRIYDEEDGGSALRGEISTEDPSFNDDDALYIIPQVDKKINEVEKIRLIVGDSTELAIGTLKLEKEFVLGSDKYTCTRHVVDVEGDESIRAALEVKDTVLKEISTQGLLPPASRFRLSIEECLILGPDVYNKVLFNGLCFDPMSELKSETRDECGKSEITKTCRLLHCLNFADKALHHDE